MIDTLGTLASLKFVVSLFLKSVEGKARVQL